MLYVSLGRWFSGLSAADQAALYRRDTRRRIGGLDRVPRGGCFGRGGLGDGRSGESVSGDGSRKGGCVTGNSASRLPRPDAWVEPFAKASTLAVRKAEGTVLSDGELADADLDERLAVADFSGMSGASSGLTDTSGRPGQVRTPRADFPSCGRAAGSRSGQESMPRFPSRTPPPRSEGRCST